MKDSFNIDKIIRNIVRPALNDDVELQLTDEESALLQNYDKRVAEVEEMYSPDEFDKDSEAILETIAKEFPGIDAVISKYLRLTDATSMKRRREQ